MNQFFRAVRVNLQETRAIAIMLEVQREPFRSVCDLSRALGVSRPCITRHIDTLQKRGFVIRKVNDDDKRLVRVWLTPAGVDVLNQIAGEAA